MIVWVAFVLAFFASAWSLYAGRRNKKLALALREAEQQKKALYETVVEIMDEEGNIRGQLALPGQVHDKSVRDRLTETEASVTQLQKRAEASVTLLKTEAKKAADELREAKGALQAARSREEKLEKTLAEVVDGDGTVLAQLRLPGEQVPPPNRTPCGDMCKLAVLNKDKKYDTRTGRYIQAQAWTCTAGQGRPCDDVRKQFVDAEGQCVLFERDDDC